MVNKCLKNKQLWKINKKLFHECIYLSHGNGFENHASPLAKVLAFLWSSSSLAIMSSKAIFPAAAKIPAWRIPPPNALRARTALWMNSFDPASIVPAGAPSPFQRQTMSNDH